jgi:CheY-like chemotaxis protein
MQLLFADNGRRAIELVDATPDLSAVLMDVMMPELDGYETMRRIRANPAHADLPIIAVTAKAMKEDREKCIEAGASDYITKPVDADQLVSLLRVWTHRRGPASEHR